MARQSKSSPTPNAALSDPPISDDPKSGFGTDGGSELQNGGATPQEIRVELQLRLIVNGQTVVEV